MSDPRVAVVIPVFKQPSLLIESVESALRQACSFDYCIILVNDGCPFPETDEVCRSYAGAYPQRIAYVRRPNGGLSAARNTGVDVALDTWPTVEAVQMLDADDRLGPLALEHGFTALQAHPEASWAYPDSRRIGFGREYVDVAGPCSGLELRSANYVMCASMVRRSVFESGRRYDERMRLGYEDWEFWMQLIDDGLAGVHVRDMDFQYRKRAESMLSESGRVHEEVMAYIRRKHAESFTPRRTLEMEHREIPRYAILLSDARRILLATDPLRSERSIGIDELPARLTRLAVQPLRDRFPLLFVVTTTDFLDSAHAKPLLPGLFWLLQTRLELSARPIAAACFEEGCSLECGVRASACTQESESSHRGHRRVIMLSTELLTACLGDASAQWSRDVRDGDAESSIDYTFVRRCGIAPPTDVPRDVLTDFVALVEELGPAFRRMPRIDLARGKIPCRPNGNSADITRRLHGCGPIFPHLAGRAALHLGFVVPVCQFGGAERGTMNLAREARRHGWVPHLFVLTSADAMLLREFEHVFETITVVESAEACAPDRLAGLLGTMNVVVANNCDTVNPTLGVLRRAGVKTFVHLHSVSINPQGMPHGQPYEALQYEHSIDGALVVSTKLARWMRGWGFPEAKLILVPNAPSFSVSDAFVDCTLIERAERNATDPLHVLYLGRFDREKGLNRLIRLCHRATEHDAPFQWRIVGKGVVAEGAPSPDDLRPLDPCIEPPAKTARSLAGLYRWADVVIMLSRFEGVPLTILEAQRFGCVVLSTNVGAIDELIEDGQTGYLFDNGLETPALVNAMLGRLTELHADRSELLRVARAAAAVRRQANWSAGFEAFASAVERLLPGNGTE